MEGIKTQAKPAAISTLILNRQQVQVQRGGSEAQVLIHLEADSMAHESFADEHLPAIRSLSRYSTSDSLIPDTEDPLMEDNVPKMNHHHLKGLNLLSSDSMVQAIHSTSCPAALSMAGHGADLDMTDPRPSNITPCIQGYFAASKSFAGNDTSLPETQMKHFWPVTKRSPDDELPNTQASSPEKPPESRRGYARLNLHSTSSALTSDADISATQVSASVWSNIAEPGSAPGGESSVTSSGFVLEDQEEISDLLSNTFKDLHDYLNIQNPPQILSASQTAKSLYDRRLPDKQPFTQPPFSSNNKAATPFSNSQLSLSTFPDGKVPLNKISCRERKRIIVSPNRPYNVTKSMRNWVRKTNWLLDPFREDEDCWLHPSPPPARLRVSGVSRPGGVLRPFGNLQKRFEWRDKDIRHTVVLNYGIVVKLINYQMTKQQQDGFINKQWHLSHLCGNWTCLNPAHTTVEPGWVNISRNNCFSHRSGCLHTPKCLKDKKAALGTDGKLVGHSDHAAGGTTDVSDLDDFIDMSGSLLLDEGDFVMDDFEDSESWVPDDLDTMDSPLPANLGCGGTDLLEHQANCSHSILPDRPDN